MANHAEEAAALLTALAHPSRSLVPSQPTEDESSLGDLQPITGLGMNALSWQLAALREVAPVETRRQAQSIRYSLAAAPAATALAALHAACCGRQDTGQ